MKTKILSSFIMLGLLASHNALSADGTVTFTGKVQDAACVIETGDENQTVNLGIVSRSAFKAPGDLAAPTRFDIRLKDCPTGVSSNGRVSARFDGDADQSAVSDGKLFRNDVQTGGATNVAIGIWNINDPANITSVLGRGQNSTPVDISYAGSVGTAKLSFMSRYVATDAAVTSGDVHAVSQFTIMYN